MVQVLTQINIIEPSVLRQNMSTVYSLGMREEANSGYFSPLPIMHTFYLFEDPLKKSSKISSLI